MQLIQLQPQIASLVPLPTSGNVNMFVDQTDNSIKTKDENGSIVGGGGSGSGGTSVITATKATMDGWISSGSLTAGQYYQITGVDVTLYGGTNIILQAASPINLSKKGLGLFYNPRYDDPASPSGGTHYYVWNNADRIAISGTTGYFAANESIIGDQGQTGQLVGLPGSSSLTFIVYSGNFSTTTFITGQTSGAISTFTGYISAATYSVGNKVIWGGTVWTNLTGVVGSTAVPTGSTKNLYLDSTNWSQVAYNVTDYDLVVDEIEYEYNNDNISLRKNANNLVISNYDWFNNHWGYNIINRFPWGHPDVLYTNIVNTFLDGVINFPNTGGYIKNISFETGGSFDATNWGFGTIIHRIVADTHGNMLNLTLGDNSIISNIILEPTSTFTSSIIANNDAHTIQLSDLTLRIGATLSGATLHSSSYLQNITIEALSQLNNNTLYPSAFFKDIKIGKDSYFGDITLSANSQIYSSNIGSASNFRNIIGGVNTLIYDVETGNDTYFGDFTIPNSFNTISNISLKTNAFFQNVTFGGSFNNIKFIDLGVAAGFYLSILGANGTLNNIGIANNATINGITLSDSSSLTYLQMGVNSQINTCTNDGVNMTNIKLDVGANLNNVTFGSDITGAYLALNSSTFPAIVDISNLSSVDLSSVDYAGLISFTSSNTAETLTNLVNTSTFPQTFSPVSGLTVVYVGTPLTGTTNGSLLMPTSAFVTNGSAFDFITFDSVSINSNIAARKIGGQNYL